MDGSRTVYRPFSAPVARFFEKPAPGIRVQSVSRNLGSEILGGHVESGNGSGGFQSVFWLKAQNARNPCELERRNRKELGKIRRLDAA